MPPTTTDPHQHRRFGPEIRFAATLIVLFVVAQLSDAWVFHHFSWSGVYGPRWGQLLRQPGYVPMWAIVALALVLHDWVPRTWATLRQASRRGLLLLSCAALGGIVGELLKMVLRRERPGLHDGAHVFRSWSDHPFNTSHLGLPSSEAAVAFAAAAALTRLFPASRVLWYALAVGCTLTRVAAGAHFMSDVVLGALVGYVSTLIVWRRGRRTATQTR